ncbi:hypothetical protein DPMN_025646 [Dreissena polymorpha]|uniref:Reverse transcriptase domain-containing protein n=1 Tax=Dreissena polymorpha TaxID=45954 RepID=A0A9D4LQ70_DREPO|nr:hypothetical protein DPMN_025646 [Dreissena polymorpha]
MNTSTYKKRIGIPWTIWKQFVDLDFADDLALLSQTQQQVQEMTNMAAGHSARLGLAVKRGMVRCSIPTKLAAAAAAAASHQLNNIGGSRAIGIITKIRLFSSIVKQILLY